jgi:hypothetical protein
VLEVIAGTLLDALELYVLASLPFCSTLVSLAAGSYLAGDLRRRRALRRFLRENRP